MRALLLTAGCDFPTGNQPALAAADGGIFDDEAAAAAAAILDEPPAPAEPRIGEKVLWDDLDGAVHESAYRLEEGQVIVEGDINLGPVDEVLARHEELRTGRRDKAFLEDKPRRRWDHTQIRWRFSEMRDTDLTTSEQSEVWDAINAWNALSDETGLTFVYRPDLKRTQHGVLIGTGDRRTSCHSNFGMMSGLTNVVLGRGCFRQRTIQHELGHALGLLHEHTRRDRASALVVYEAMVERGVMDLGQYRIDDAQSAQIGPLDVESNMIYESFNDHLRTWDAASGPLQFPGHLSRETLNLWLVEPNPGFAPLLQTYPHDVRNGWNRLGGAYARLDQMRAVDADGDGTDDLVAELGDELYFSRSGAMPWHRLELGGQPVSASVDEILCGFLDSHGGQDTVSIRGFEWTLWSSDGTRRTSVRSSLVSDFELLPDGSGVFVILADGRWAVTTPDDPLGPLQMITPSSMSVSNVKLVQHGWGRTFAVASSGGSLYVASVDRSLTNRSWSPLFPARIPSPYPSEWFPTDIDEVWFGLVDFDFKIDMLFGRQVRDRNRTGHSPVEPLYVSDVFGNASGIETPFEYPSQDRGISVDLSRSVVVGRFNDPDRLSMMAYGWILKREVMPTRWMSRLDAQALGQRYLSAGPTRLADKYPLDYSSAALRDPQRVTQFVEPPAGSYFELRGVFMSPSGVTGIDVTLWRLRTPYGGWSIVETEPRTLPSQPRVATIDYPFVMPDSGTYMITMTPADQTAASPEDRAVWIFTGVSRCGDGFVEMAEECDDDNNVDGDGCSSACTWEAICGDANTVSPETCDDGNLSDGDGCSSVCTWESTCGDGSVGPGEQCDDGNRIERDTCSNDCQIILE